MMTMDHLFLPFGSSVDEHDRVEYLGSTSYQGVPFLEYVGSSGHGFLLDHIAVPPSGPDANVSQTLAGAPEDDLSLGHFLQEWLFCSFLQEVFGMVPHTICGLDMYNHHDFVCKMERTSSSVTVTSSSENRPSTPTASTQAEADRGPIEVNYEHNNHKYILTTKNLRSLSQRWTIMIKGNPEKAESAYIHLNKCLKIISDVLRRFRLAIDVGTRVAVTATISYIVVMIKLAFVKSAILDQDPLDLSSWIFHGWDESHVAKMRDLGWCPNEASKIRRFGSLQTLHFCANMKRPKSQIDHMHCTTADCIATTVGNLPLHRCGSAEKGPLCNPFTVEDKLMDQMLDIIKDGGLPVLEIEYSQGNMKLDIKPRRSDNQYVALSHVWCDGMGNPTANALPLCQLSIVFSRVSQICQEKNKAQPEKILVWIDTLCCPIEPYWAKVKVLAQMRRIYEEAEYVLVFDAELEQIDNRGMDILEVSFRVLTSNWMRRLWTLQEGFLARKLWVQFQHEAFDIDQLRTLDVNLLGIESLMIGETIKIMYLSLRRRMVAETDSLSIEWNILSLALRDRAVTYSSDEALCIATLLDLDIERIAMVNQKSKEELASNRMKILWDLIGKSRMAIPADILFHSAPKLKHSGYRWAPSTLLKEGKSYNSVAWGPSFLAQSAHICPHGLLVKFEGLLVSSKRRPIRCLQRYFRQVSSSKCYHLRDKSGQWFILYGVHEYDIASSEQIKHTNAPAEETCQYGVINHFRIIDKNTVNEDASSYSIFVKVEENAADKVLVRFLQQVLLQAQRPSKCAVLELAHNIARSLDEADIVRAVRKNEELLDTADISDSTRSNKGDPSGNSTLNEEPSASTPASEQETAIATEIGLLITESCKKALEDAPETITAMRGHGVAKPQLYLGAVVHAMLAGCFALDAEIRRADQVWCVD